MVAEDGLGDHADAPEEDHGGGEGGGLVDREAEERSEEGNVEGPPAGRSIRHQHLVNSCLQDLREGVTRAEGTWCDQIPFPSGFRSSDMIII